MKGDVKLRKIGKLAVFMLVFFAVSSMGIAVSAGTFGGFSIRAVIPDNQIDKRQTYFDLRMKPGDEQELQVVITNSRDEEITAEVSLNDASTGRNGLIVYTKPDSRDEIMKLAITDVATPLTQMVTIPAQSSETATIRIKMPEEGFDGVLLGGIAVTGKNDKDSEEKEETTGVSLKNTITYVVALKLTENNEEMPPDFELVSVRPELVNYKTAVVADLRNMAARIVENMEINAAVYNKGSDAAIQELALDRSEMAPLSKGSFVIDWGGQTLNPGTYRLKMTAGYNDRLWEWDEEFTISGEAEELNRNAVGMQKNYFWIYLALGVAALVLVFLFAFFLGRRKNGRDEQRP